jgi:hypothetical protein
MIQRDIQLTIPAAMGQCIRKFDSLRPLSSLPELIQEREDIEQEV